jgi:ABC-type branched-subunit amino acid transport system ATPase component
VDDVALRFGGVVALDRMSIRVRPGEIVGLIGPNGAGKTTLINVISGVSQPDAGSVRLFGNEVADLAADFRAAFGLGRSFQDANLFAGLTVKETIQVALGHRYKVGVIAAMLSAPWARATEQEVGCQADDVAAAFGLSAWSDALTSELSTGTRRICDLASQVAAAPKLILLDEPTAGVAQRDAEAFGPLVRRIRDLLDCSILIVEHDMPLLMGLCDRVCAMEQGRVIAEGTPEEIRRDPAVIASYLGTEEIAIRRSGMAEPIGASHLTGDHQAMPVLAVSQVLDVDGFGDGKSSTGSFNGADRKDRPQPSRRAP